MKDQHPTLYEFGESPDPDAAGEIQLKEEREEQRDVPSNEEWKRNSKKPGNGKVGDPGKERVEVLVNSEVEDVIEDEKEGKGNAESFALSPPFSPEGRFLLVVFEMWGKEVRQAPLDSWQP